MNDSQMQTATMGTTRDMTPREVPAPAQPPCTIGVREDTFWKTWDSNIYRHHALFAVVLDEGLEWDDPRFHARVAELERRGERLAHVMEQSEDYSARTLLAALDGHAR